MLLHLRRSFILSAIFLVLLGLAYPLAGTGLAQAFFGHQANGSLTANGSTLIGQTWAGPKWFQGRPDGTVLTNKPDQVVVSGTNQPGPLSASLEKSVAQQAEILKKEGIIPTNDLVTTSGSLVDPDISPSDGYAQIDAVAAARGLPPATVRQLVASHVHSRELGFLGAPYVDVLELNDALATLG
ncbi:MAG TPA: potassium-transporting ATPase subunit C [Acidimicrobiales bacterium]|nr:potassium-transporting ATPase subunit C [Acidimicrobiales bacterium]